MPNTPPPATPHIERRGILFILSSPSGAGKTTLGTMLRESDGQVTLSVSVTTRAPRAGEKDGKDYIFVSEDEFQAMKKRGEFLEQASVFGNNYGTLRAAVKSLLDGGQDVLFDVDWQGRQQLADSFSADVVSVFILPPDAAALKERLVMRAQDSAEARNYRMKFAPSEISHYAEYDYIVINHDLSESLMRIKSILFAERQKRVRQTGLRAFVDKLRSDLQ